MICINVAYYIFHDSYIIKKFGSGIDKIRFQKECQIYQKLDGHEITPKLIEIGDNYLKIEKYETSLEEVLINRKINSLQYREIYNKIVVLVKKLDNLGVVHNDLAPRNIVCKNNLMNVAIIDFELACVCVAPVTNFSASFYENFSVDI